MPSSKDRKRLANLHKGPIVDAGELHQRGVDLEDLRNATLQALEHGDTPLSET